MIKINLKWWLGGPELTKLKNAAEIWFNRVAGWANWPLQQLDPETCSLGLLHLIAWQRGIDQFAGEPERQYRLRTKYAYANAADAGSSIGFERIFARMELGAVTINERLEDRDFDIIELEVTDTTVAKNADYLNWLIQTYGRTCRRYEWKVVTPISVAVRPASFSCDYGTYYCS
ncbi:phage tail protein [Endozoicomonas sp. GU-1]|uniref:phage tail protein n=1 Tax=Endozoicomonas sp. GU-1 TaxID=3009078 RepID=UPI0022B44770|nr:phage tail protein [Endozoicomonas sp. GU-1]WBA86531.1 phage tail protein [Endozoicomonas sp. GU-1]